MGPGVYTRLAVIQGNTVASSRVLYIMYLHYVLALLQHRVLDHFQNFCGNVIRLCG